MRRGNNPSFLLDKRGAIFAIATGSDSTAEHECGSQALQQALCCGLSSSDGALLTQLKAGEAVQWPSLLQRKTIDHNLQQLQFVEGADPKLRIPAAVLAFSARAREQVGLDHPELALWDPQKPVAGAWDEESFAFKVAGDKLVAKLRAFAQALREADGVFAGTFLEDAPKSERLAGVVIARRSLLRPEHLAAVSKAQQKWQDEMLLKARSRVDELHALARCSERHVVLPGYVWPVWKNQMAGGDVLYALNPGHGVKAQYWGPYTFEQLREWMLATEKFTLKPLQSALPA